MPSWQDSDFVHHLTRSATCWLSFLEFCFHIDPTESRNRWNYCISSMHTNFDVMGWLRLQRNFLVVIVESLINFNCSLCFFLCGPWWLLTPLVNYPIYNIVLQLFLSGSDRCSISSSTISTGKQRVLIHWGIKSLDIFVLQENVTLTYRKNINALPREAPLEMETYKKYEIAWSSGPINSNNFFVILRRPLCLSSTTVVYVSCHWRHLVFGRNQPSCGLSFCAMV